MTTKNQEAESRTLSRRRQRTRQQREWRRQRLAIVVAVAILLVVVAIPVYGYYTTFVAPPRRVIASINGVEHTLGEMVELTRATVAFQARGGGQPNLSSLPFEVLNNIVEAELIRQVAPSPSVGLTVTQDEIDQRIRGNFYPTVPEGQQPTTQDLEREYKESYREYLSITGYSDKQYREIVRLDILRAKARERMSDQVPTVEEQVYVEWILLDRDSRTAQEDQETIRQRFNEGAEFATLARQFSVENRYADSNGVVGWVPRGAFPDLDDQLFLIGHNTLSEAIFTNNGYYFLRVTDGPETREVSEKMQEALKSSIFQQWLLDLRVANDIQVNFSSYEYEWLVRKIREFAPLPSDQGGS